MNNNLQGDAIAAAIDVLNEERVIAYPTEAVFGVGCDPDSETAVMRLLELKQRPVDKGLILIAANYEQLKPYIDDTMLTDAQRETIFSPGSVIPILCLKPDVFISKAFLFLTRTFKTSSIISLYVSYLIFLVTLPTIYLKGYVICASVSKRLSTASS